MIQQNNEFFLKNFYYTIDYDMTMMNFWVLINTHSNIIKDFTEDKKYTQELHNYNCQNKKTTHLKQKE